MKNVRIIARLDIKGPNLVKGVHLEGLRVLGKPEEYAKRYYLDGADELIYQDVVASLYERNSLKDIITRTAKETFIPLTVGGGIRCIDDVNEVLRAGADKVAINTAAIKNPELINKAAKYFGSSTIVVAVEAIKQIDGSYLAYTDNGREYMGVDVFKWVKEVEERGAGEILLTSIDREGTGQGFDLELIQKVASIISIPAIAHGGAGSAQDIVDVVKKGQADAVAISSVLHYGYIKSNQQLRHHEEEGNVEFLKQKSVYSKFGSLNMNSIKRHLIENGVCCRLS